MILPVSYWRTAEFGYVLRQLKLPQGSRVLDVGSPKELAAILAHRHQYAVVATDILPEAVELSVRFMTAQAIRGDGPGKVCSEIQDGRSLGYPDDCFDGVFSVSVLEHIPDDGDSVTIQEFLRVVKPGGLLVITVPYAPAYRETFVNHAVYEREQLTNEPVFFERHYDDDGLRARLLDVAGGRLENLELWGEGRIRVEMLLRRLGRFEVVASPLHPALSGLFLRRLEARSGHHPMAAFLTLRKPS